MKKDPNAAAEADMEAAIMAQLDLDMEDLMKGGSTDMIIVEFYNSNVNIWYIWPTRYIVYFWSSRKTSHPNTRNISRRLLVNPFGILKFSRNICLLIPAKSVPKSFCHTPASFSNSARPEFTDVGKLDLSRPQQLLQLQQLGNYWKRANVMLD